jgi:hypothetical protein
LALVQRHQVYGLVHAALSEQPEVACIPSQVLASVAASARRSRLDALLRLSEARRVADALQRAGVAAVQLKGAPLSERLYADALLRHSMDIDVLVPLALLPEAVASLRGLGYATDEHLPSQPGLRSRFQRRAYHHCQLHGPANVTLELHWRLGTYSEAHTDRLMAQSQPSTTTGLSTLPLGLELAYLVAHGTNHYWSRLKWLSDIKQALLSLPAATWREFTAECRAVDVGAAVEVTRRVLNVVFAQPSAVLPGGFERPQVRHLRAARYALYRMQGPLSLQHGLRAALHQTRYRLDCAPTYGKFTAALRVAAKVRRQVRHS